MGLAAAYFIRKQTRRDVLVLDRYGIGNDYCSSNDVNRVFRYAYGNDELYTRMAVESFDLWHGLEKESGEKLLIETGLLLLNGNDRNANAFNEASYNTLSRMRLGAESISREELGKRFPQFRADEAFFDTHGGVLLASKALQTLHNLAAKRGVRLQKREAQEVVLGDRPHIVTRDTETIEFRKLVVTIGAWSNRLLNEKLVSIRPTRQQIIYFRPNTMESFRPERCPVFFSDKHYGLPAAGINAVKMSPKELDETVDPETAKRSVDEQQIVEAREACRRFMPEIANTEVFQTKVCLYDMTDNSDFVLDSDPENSNIVYGYGFSGHGFKFAPLIGKLLAELALDSKPSVNLERFTVVPSNRRTPKAGAQLGKGE